MKKIFLLVFLFLLTLFSNKCFPQTETRKNNECKWGGSVAINSLSGQFGFRNGAMGVLDGDGNINGPSGDIKNKSLSLSIIPKFSINNNLITRFELGVTNIYGLIHYDGKEQNHAIVNEAIRETIFRFNPGVQWNYFRNKRFELYAGSMFSCFTYGKLSYSENKELRELVSDTLIVSVRYNNTRQGGFAAGVGAFIGGSIYLNKNISLGAEFSSSLLYYHAGGNGRTEAYTVTPPSPNIVYQTYDYVETYQSIQFSKIIGSFNISIKF